jgi:hypothetical protein
MNKYIILAIITFFTLQACEKKLDIDLPENEKKIVLNGIINPDSLIRVNVSRSQNILDKDEDIQYLINADVQLFINDEYAEDLIYSDRGYYESSIIPQTENIYEITVAYPSLNSISAKTKLISAVPILNVDTTVIQEQNDDRYSEFPVYNGYEIHYKIDIKDNADERNYYFLSLYSIVPSFDEEGNLTEYYDYYEWYDSNDLIYNDENQDFIIDGIHGKVFSDELFNGNTYTIDLETYYWPQRDDVGNIYQPSDVKTYIILLTVNEEMFRYIKSYNLNQTTVDNPFAQPVQIFSNVDEGLGLFTGYSKHVDSLIFNY